MRKQALVIALLAAGITSSGAHAATPALPRMSIFIVAGQSNALGYGFPISAEQPIRHVFNVTDGTLQYAIDPLVPGGGVGFGRSFGAYLAKRGMVVGLVDCAWGGSSLDMWQPAGVAYQVCVPLVRAAEHYGVVRGLLWSQGETDSTQTAWASTWATRFTTVVQTFRKLVGSPNLPVVFQRTLDFTSCVECDLPYGPILRSQQESVAIPQSAMVNADDLPHNGEHFTPSGYAVLGQRMAQAFLRVRPH